MKIQSICKFIGTSVLFFVGMTLSGCILSAQPLITDSDSILPFGDYAIFRQENTNSDTGQPEDGGRVAFERSGNGYIVKSIDAGGLSAFNGQKIMLAPLSSGDKGSAYIAQALYKGNDDDGPPMWMYAMLVRWNTGKIDLYTFENTLDCSKIPDDILPTLSRLLKKVAATDLA